MTTQAGAQLLTDSAVPDGTPQPLLCPDHYKELASGSAISEGLIKLNFRSTADSKEIAKFLGWKDYRHAPGWIVQGIDPETGEVAHFGQFKPDSKQVFPNGQEAKYLTLKCQYEAICLQVEAADYWQKVLADPTFASRKGAKKPRVRSRTSRRFRASPSPALRLALPKAFRGVNMPRSYISELIFVRDFENFGSAQTRKSTPSHFWGSSQIP